MVVKISGVKTAFFNISKSAFDISGLRKMNGSILSGSADGNRTMPAQTNIIESPEVTSIIKLIPCPPMAIKVSFNSNGTKGTSAIGLGITSVELFDLASSIYEKMAHETIVPIINASSLNNEIPVSSNEIKPHHKLSLSPDHEL